LSACRRYRNLLVSSLDGTLSAPERERLRTHLDLCPGCAQALEDQRRTLAQIKALDSVEPPPWLEQRILAGIRARPAAPRPRLARWLAWSPLPAAAVVVLCVTGYLLMRVPGSKGGMSVPAPEQPAAAPPPAPFIAQPGTGRFSPPPPARPRPATAAPAPEPAGTAAGAAAEGSSSLDLARQAALPSTTAEAPGAAQDQVRASTRKGIQAEGFRAPGAALDQPRASVQAKGAQEEASGTQRHARTAPVPALALSLQPRDPAQAGPQAMAAFQAAGATLVTRPGPDRRFLAARVPAAALDGLLRRLDALGDLTGGESRPEAEAGGEVLVTLAW
jgi:hypothetical protein